MSKSGDEGAIWLFIGLGLLFLASRTSKPEANANVEERKHKTTIKASQEPDEEYVVYVCPYCGNYGCPGGGQCWYE